MKPTVPSPYKKSWIVATMIARDLILLAPGDRVPTIQEFTERLNSSRGIVQNALKRLQDEQAIRMEKRGKAGTFLLSSNLRRLFVLAGLQYVTGSMPPPVNKNFASFATGVCAVMRDCPTHFNFSFMHSSENRAKALTRSVYDCVFVSLHSAKKLADKYPSLSVAMTFPTVPYGRELILVTGKAGARDIADGDSIAVDPNSNDQYDITMALCAGKNVRIVETPYLSTGTMLSSGRVDFAVRRVDEADLQNIPPDRRIPLESGRNRDMMIPALLTNRNNYGVDNILRKYLDEAGISAAARDVRSGAREPEFY